MRERANLKTSIDEVRKLIFEAENKYRFSIYNGDPSNLAAYLMSEDFKLVLNIFESANSLDILEEILLEARKKYSDIITVVNAIEAVIKILRSRRGKDNAPGGVEH